MSGNRAVLTTEGKKSVKLGIIYAWNMITMDERGNIAMMDSRRVS